MLNQYLTATDQYLVNAYIVKAIFNWSSLIFKWLLQTCNSKTDIPWMGNGIYWNSQSIE